MFQVYYDGFLVRLLFSFSNSPWAAYLIWPFSLFFIAFCDGVPSLPFGEISVSGGASYMTLIYWHFQKLPSFHQEVF